MLTHTALETGRFVLVHNGVIENYLWNHEEYLAGSLISRGKQDTEIDAAHLIGKFAEEDGLRLKLSLKSLHIIRGAYAFCFDGVEDPSTIYVAK